MIFSYFRTIIYVVIWHQTSSMERQKGPGMLLYKLNYSVQIYTITNPCQKISLDVVASSASGVLEYLFHLALEH